MATSTPKKKTGPVPVAKNKIDAFGEDQVIDLITEGRGYRYIAGEIGVAVGSLFTWIEENPERSIRCAKASELASNAEDEAALEAIESAASMFDLAKAREVAIHRRWRAKALAPKKYGDKQQVDLTAKVEIDMEQVDKRLERLLAKAK